MVWPQVLAFPLASWDFWSISGVLSGSAKVPKTHLGGSTPQPARPLVCPPLLSLPQALVSFFHAEGQGLPLESLRDGSYKVRPRPSGDHHIQPTAPQ